MDLASHLKQLYVNHSLGEVVKELHKMGYSQFDSAKLIRSALKLPLAVIGKAINEHEVWSKYRSANDQFFDDFFEIEAND